MLRRQSMGSTKLRRAIRIAVIGGGIGGLAAARALHQRGFEASVFEAAQELKEIGAGLALHPNAMKALRSLDLEASVRAVAWESEYQVVRDGRTGRILTGTPQRGYLEQRFGAAGCTVHRRTCSLSSQRRCLSEPCTWDGGASVSKRTRMAPALDSRSWFGPHWTWLCLAL